MKFHETGLSGSYLIDLEPHQDERGFFARYYCEREFSTLGLNTRWVQVNDSLSKDKGTLRGLHFQRHPHTEVKLVRCIQGSIWDVIVDVRKGSKTFGKWFGTELSAINRRMIYLPEGFAHGFVTLQPNSEIIYLVSDFYAPEAEQTLFWGDKSVAIEWPIYPSRISDKDSQGKRLSEIDPIYTSG